MKRLRLTIGLMAVAILTMVACLVWFSPLMMTFFMIVAPACAGLAMVLFVIDTLQTLD